MAVQYAVEYTRVAQYDGGNSAEVIALIDEPGFPFEKVEKVSEADGVLTVRMQTFGGPENGGADMTVQIRTSQWVVPHTGGFVRLIDDELFQSGWSLHS